MQPLRPISLKNRKQFLERVVADNPQYTNLANQLKFMEEFMILNEMHKKVDVFSYVPKDKRMAVGYRIVHKQGSYIAEPWTWIVDNELKLTGTEIGSMERGSTYYGVIVKPELLTKYGATAYSLLLGNLRMLEQNKARLQSL